MKRPGISTFAGTNEQVKNAIQSGADHLILEDAKVCIRSFTDDFKVTNFTKIKDLSEYALQLNPKIKLSCNIDILVHERHFPIIEALLKTLKKTSVSAIRIQDPGLIPYLKETSPELEIHLSTEIGTNNTKGIHQYASLGCSRQRISNELPYNEIKTLDPIRCDYELQVHGPLLIQYSKRRFQNGYHVKNKRIQAESTSTRQAQDSELKNRSFQFYDSPNGHCMFAHFNNCLYPHLNIVGELPLSYWLIDARGETNKSLKTSITSYKIVRDALVKGKDWSSDKTVLDELKKQSSRPLKPGFFIHNKTDKDWRNNKISLKTHAPYIGKVIHAEKRKHITIECIQTIKVEDTLILTTPEKKQLQLKVKKILTLSNSPIKVSSDHCLIKVPWLKGVCVGTLVHKPLSLLNNA